MVRTGRLQVFNSGRAEIEHIEIDQNVFAYQTTELKLTAFTAVEVEVGCFFANTDGHRRVYTSKEQ